MRSILAKLNYFKIDCSLIIIKKAIKNMQLFIAVTKNFNLTSFGQHFIISKILSEVEI